MKKILSFVCAIFLLHNSCALPAGNNNPFFPYVNELFMATNSDELTSTIMSIQEVVLELIDAAINSVLDTSNTKIDFVNTYVPGAVADLEKLVSTVDSNIATSLKKAKTLSAETRAAIQGGFQGAVTKVLEIIHSFNDKLTMGIQAISGQIVSEAEGSVESVLELVQNVPQDVLTTIVSSYSSPREATQTMKKFVSVANNGLNGVQKCIENEASYIRTNVKGVLGGFKGEATVIYQYVKTCLSLTSDSEIIACFYVSLKTL